MLRFKNYLSEEVRPAAGVKNDSIDIESSSVRGQINATLANVTAQPAVTPYIVMHRITKALSYFHIVMPKRAYLEGDRGVEAIEVKQFGDRMGMTNDGQFVHSVPSKYYLFISYRLAPSMGADYSFVGDVASSIGGMFKVTAKLVDEIELQRLLSAAEVSLAEDCDAEKQQLKAKFGAPKDPMKNVDDSTEGTEAAADETQRKKDKKLSASSLDEAKKLKGRPDPKLSYFDPPKPEKKKKEPARTKGSPDPKLSYFDNPATKAERKKYIKSLPFKEETQIDEVSKGAAIRAYGSAMDASDSDSRAEKTAGRLKKHIVRKFGKKTGEHAERHAYASHFGRPNKDYGTDRLASAKPSSEMRKTKSGKVHKQDVESKKSEIKFRKTMSKFDKKGNLPEDYSFRWSADNNRIDETRMPASVIRHKQKLANMTPEEKAKKFAGKSEEQLKSMARRHGYGKDSNEYSKHLTKEDKDPCWNGYEMVGMKKKGGKPVPNCVPVKEESLDEKLNKAMSAGDVISDFVHSKDKTFEGDTKKKRINRALGAYYGMHPEKSKKKLEEMMSRVKKTTAHRKLATGVNTQTRHALVSDRETETIAVKRIGKPGSEPVRIKKDKFDPSKHIKA